MKLFKQNKAKCEWTEKSAPKNKPIDVEITICVRIHKNPDEYSVDVREIAQISSKEMIVSNTDSDRTIILDQVEEKLRDSFEKIETLVLSNETMLTDGFWEELKATKEKENKSNN